MSRRRKNRSMYLNPEFEEINDAASQKDGRAVWYCRCGGWAYLGEKCRTCKKKLKDNAQMPVNLPKEVKNPGQKGTGSFGGGHGTVHGGGQWTTVPQCYHPGDKVVYEDNGKSLYGAKGFNLNEFSGEWDLIIDLAGQVRSNTSFIKPVTNKKYDVLKKHVTGQQVVKSEVLSLDWQDMKAAPASLDFWLTLWNMLPAKTVMCCVGGHGRTGTCLTALMIASGLDFYSAVKTVRDEHCNKAIETLEQLKYLWELYKELLKRKIVIAQSAGNAADIFDLEHELKFTEENPPGVKEKTAGTKQQTMQNQSDTKQLTTAIANAASSDNWKVVGGKTYHKVCVNNDCKLPYCAINDHEGWVEWDFPDGNNMDHWGVFGH